MILVYVVYDSDIIVLDYIATLVARVARFLDDVPRQGGSSRYTTSSTMRSIKASNKERRGD